MKYLILLGDGMADWPLEAYEGRTPLEVAYTPAMDEVVSLGVTGQFYPIPEGLPAGSDIGNLSVFGYNPGASFRGRAPIEAARNGIHLSENEVAFRCNLVSLQDGVMQDFTAGHIETETGHALMDYLNETLGKEFPVVFHHGISYRHPAIVTASAEASVQEMCDMNCTPPHDISDREWASHVPQGAGSEMIQRLIRRSQELLPEHPINQARAAEGKAMANSVWFWGQGRAPEMVSFAEKFGLSGAVISAVDLVNGIGVLAGLEAIDVPGATGWIDTNYAGKINAAIEALDRHDFVYVHIEAPDETAHQGRADLKIQAIEDFDRQIVAPALAYYATHPDLRILVTPDHYTLIETKTHAGGPIPFALCGKNIKADAHTCYSEKEAATTAVSIAEGHTLTERMIREDVFQL